MNKREQEIFLRGIAVGMKAVEEFEVGFTQLVGEKSKSISKKSGRKSGLKLQKWTEEDDNIVRDTINLSCTEVNRNYLKHRTALSIQARRGVLGLKKERKLENNNIAKLNQ